MNGIKSLVVLGLVLANEKAWQKTEQRERGRVKYSPSSFPAGSLPVDYMPPLIPSTPVGKILCPCRT